MFGNTVHRSSTLSLILSLFILVTESQASPVQTVVGTDANFSFLLNEDPGSSIVKIKDHNGGIVMAARGSVSMSSNPIYSDRVNFTGNTNQKLISFILRNVTLLDAGMYIATIGVFPSPDRTIGSQMLIVKASPSKPQIIELNGPAVNGSDYRLNCSAKSNSEPPNHNLTMLTEWRKDNQTITPAARYIMNLTELTITGLNYIQDNRARLICVAFEDQIAKSVYSNEFIIDINYGPGNSVNLGSIPPTIGVELNQMAPDITCSATCNPPCDYRWYQNGIFYRKEATLYLGIVEKTTRGDYRCEASNSVHGVNRSSSTFVNISVYYAPEVLLKPAVLPRPIVYILKLGQTNVGLTCVVIDASPPAQQFIWTKDGQEILTQTSQTFTIPIVTKDTMGRWGCKGVNSKGNPLESTLDIDVHYGPIITKLPNITKVEGDSITVTCVVDSRPDPSSISWTKSQNNTFTRNKSEMYIAYLNKADKGTYECTAVNTIQPTGESVGERITVKSSYILDVTYPPILTMKATNTSKGGRVVISCMVSGVPDNYTFYKWTHMAPDESRTIVRELEVTRVSGSEVSLTIEGATYQDSGFYVCKASNGIAHYRTGQLIMEDMVSVWIADQPIITSNVRYFDAERGKSGYIHIEFYSGIIQPVITWYLVKNGTMELLQNSSGFGIYLSTVRVEIQYYQKTVQLLGYNASLEVFNVHEEQFTSYKVEINNSFAEPVFRTLELKPRVPSTAESLGLPVAGLAGGISAGLVVIFIMGIGIVLWRRNQHKKQNEHDNDVAKVHEERRSQMKSSSIKKDNASGKVYEGLHFKETEDNQYLQLNGITLEETRNVDIRSPESDSYEQLHPYVNKDIQMYSTLNISKTLKDAEQKYENTWIKTPDTTDESKKTFDRFIEDIV